MQKNNNRRLGRGLEALISIPPADERASAIEPSATAAKGAKPPRTEPAAGAEAGPKAAAVLVAVGQIRPNPFQPRKEIAPAQLQALAESIRKQGVLQPIVLRPKGEAYELIAGERRWRASQMAGLNVIPSVVRDATDAEMLELALVENIFREDLNAIDRALAYRRYSDEFQLSPEDIAARLGEDRTTVTNYLRLLELPGEVKAWVAEGKLAMGHARCLLAIRSPSELVRLAKQVIDEDLSVRAVEKLVRERVAARAEVAKPAGGPVEKRPQIRNLEQAFVRSLGTKVEINESRRKGRGRIVIHYYSLDDFDRVVGKLGVQPE